VRIAAAAACAALLVFAPAPAGAGTSKTFPTRVQVTALLASLAVLVPAQAGAKTYPARVQVTAKEFWFALSSRSVKSGPAVIEFVNFGQDAHDMKVQKVGTTKVYSVPLTQPGSHYDLSIKLLPGRYQLWCSVANHKQLGMQATLIVKPGTA
jgi:plastocyanin